MHITPGTTNWQCGKMILRLSNINNLPSQLTGSDQASLQKGRMFLSETHSVCSGSTWTLCYCLGLKDWFHLNPRKKRILLGTSLLTSLMMRTRQSHVNEYRYSLTHIFAALTTAWLFKGRQGRSIFFSYNTNKSLLNFFV